MLARVHVSLSPSIQAIAATIMKDAKPMPIIETQSSAIKVVNGQSSDVEYANCDCCGLTEECTLAYISRVRERYQGRWICGLCAEAVKDEILRSERRIGTEEALNRHMNFRRKFRSSSPPPNPTEELISAMKQLLLRSLDTQTALRSSPGRPMKKEASLCARSSLVRSKSCYSALDG